MRHNFEELHATLPMIFTDKKRNNEPLLFEHQCEPSRKGKPISDQELMDFALDLLIDLYSKQGMKIKSKNRIQNCEYPNLVLQDKSGKTLFVAIKVDRFPINPISISDEDCDALIELAKEADPDALALLAPMSFGDATNAKTAKDLSNCTCGGSYFVAFRGLMEL